MQYQFVRKKQTVHLAIPNSDTLVDAFVTVYPIHMDHGSSNFLQKFEQLFKSFAEQFEGWSSCVM